MINGKLSSSSDVKEISVLSDDTLICEFRLKQNLQLQ